MKNSKKLPAVIPLIKLRDNGSNPKKEFYFGNDTHDCLMIRDGGIHYYNLQNSEGTGLTEEGEENDSYEFVGKSDGYYDGLVEKFNLEAYISKFKAEIKTLKAENKRLRARLERKEDNEDD